MKNVKYVLVFLVSLVSLYGCERILEQAIPIGNLIETSNDTELFSNDRVINLLIHNSGANGDLIVVVTLKDEQEQYIAHKIYEVFFAKDERRKVSFKWPNPPKAYEVHYDILAKFLWDKMGEENRWEAIYD